MEYPFSEFLRILGKGPKSRRSLTVAEAQQAMKMVLDGEVTDRQMGAFLLLMRANGESQQELVGFLTGLRDYYQLNDSRSGVDLDISAYAGKWRYPPYFLLSIKLLAQNGYKVLLHGDSGQFEDRQYAESFAEQLGFYIANSIEDANNNIRSGQAVYLPLDRFAPQLKTILHLKQELGVRTVFNTAVKLLNPLNAKFSMQGIFHKGVENLHHAASQVNGCQRNLVFKGEGGEPEIRPDALNRLFFSNDSSDELTSFDFKSITERHKRTTWQPADLLKLWQGSDDEYGKQAAIATTAVALMLIKNVTVEVALQEANTMWSERLA
jgi:anthranilate phosphoribosyltransferase